MSEPTTRYGGVCAVRQYLKQIDERIGYHRDSLSQWRSGLLAPTEPDEEEREKTIAGLEAAIASLQVARDLFVGIYGEGR